jgi:hypothetical protein
VKKVVGLQLLKGSKGHHMVLESMTATNKNEETEEMVVEQDPFDDLPHIHIHIHSHLLPPLLIQEDKIILMTDLWNPNHTAQEVEKVLLDIV